MLPEELPRLRGIVPAFCAGPAVLGVVVEPAMASYRVVMGTWSVLLLVYGCTYGMKVMQVDPDRGEVLAGSSGHQPVALMWGIADTTATVGRLFQYHIPSDAFKGSVDKYVVSPDIFALSRRCLSLCARVKVFYLFFHVQLAVKINFLLDCVGSCLPSVSSFHTLEVRVRRVQCFVGLLISR